MRKHFSKLDLIVSIVLSGVFVLSVIAIALTSKNSIKPIVEEQLKNKNTELSVGESENNNNTETEDNSLKESSLAGPLLAPFIDMASWVDTSNNYSINGTPNLGVIYDEIGCEYYFLGFIRPDDNAPLSSDGSIRWGWGGFYELSEDGNEGFQYEGIKKSIQNIRDRGGDVIVSVGGQLGNAPWTITQNITKLKEMYLEIIEAYNLEVLDLDIEEVNQGYEQNVANAKAIKRVQDATGIEITLTIPIMPYGYTSTQKNLLRAYIGNGVNIKFINNMTMCYGSEVNEGEDFAEASIRATENAKEQIKAIYNEYGLGLTDEEIYKLLGATVDIGYENQHNPVFTPQMTKQVASYANEKGLGMFSFWCVNRDCMMQYNKAINTQYEHYDASLAFLGKK